MDARTAVKPRGVLQALLALLVCGFAAAGWEASWTRTAPPVYAHTVLAGLGVAIAGLVSVICGCLYVVRRSGRLTDHARVLAILQAVGGGAAVVAFYLLAGIEQPYAALNGGFHGATLASAIGLLLVLIVIFVPCFLLGASLALGLGLARAARSGTGTSAGLAAAFFGLAAGVTASNFLLLPTLGARGLVLCAAGAMVAAGALSLAAGRLADRQSKGKSPGSGEAISPAPDPIEVGTPGGPGPTVTFVSVAVLVASASTSALVWGRVCQQAAGSTSYTVAAAAGVWLAFVGFGLLLAGRLKLDFTNRPHLTGLGMALASALWLVPLYFVDDLPFLFLKAPGGGYIALALAVFMVPGLVVGAALALTLAPSRPGVEPVSGRAATRLAAVVAGVLAALVLGLVIPSRLITLRSAAVLAPWPAIAAGICLMARRPLHIGQMVVAGGIAALALAASLVAPPWNDGILTGGVYARPDGISDLKSLRATLEGADVLYCRAGCGRVVSVLRSPDGISLRENGRTVASTGADLPAQMLAAHIPLLVCQDPRRVLILGLATGITVGSAETHPVEGIDCVEPLPAVVAAARHFAPYNRQALTDSRVDLIICDPANYLLLTDDQYDVIISRQILASEVVRLARSKLSPTGVFCDVIDLDVLSKEATKLLAKEVAVHFPYVGLWWAGGSRLVLAGSMAALKVKDEVLRDRLAYPDVIRDLARLEAVNDVGILSLYMMGRESLLAWAAGAPAYSRDRAFAIYQAPGRHEAGAGPDVLAELDRFHDNPVALLADVEPDEIEYTIISGQLGRCMSAKTSYFKSLVAARSSRFREASAQVEDARSNCPENGLLVVEASDFYVSSSRALARSNRQVEAIDTARRALELRPESPRAFYNLATLEIGRDPVTAAALLYRATELDPAYLPAYLLQAEAEINAGRLGPASETLSKALSLAPFNLRAYHLRGICSLRAGQIAEARADFERVVAAEPRDAAALSAIAYTWLLEENLEKAQRFYEKALDVSPHDLEALNNLATVLAERQEYRRATEIWEKALELDPGNQSIRANLQEVRQRMSGS